MKKNPDKCHLVIRASAPKIMKIRVNSKKLIDVTINSKLNFNNNLDRILQKAGKKSQCFTNSHTVDEYLEKEISDECFLH